ncbi:unnamed protein product [Hymenolepis diminuta]|uniref:FH2 domain-containing protein n=1 Tax=Hymenolepis diminuta TaxID=6216 RepID=A0A0R3S9T6_HYMDI|nr:unnamed protein product [Hymenolepis diminuta]
MQKWIGTERRTLEEEKKKLKCNESKFKENLKESERKTIESVIKQADVLGTVLKAVIKFQRRLQVKPQNKGQPKKTTDQDHQIPADEQFDLTKYFKNPSELIDLLKDLETSNLTLIQNCQDAEEIIESLRKTEETLKEESETEVATLTEKVKHLREIILNGDDEYIEEFNQKVTAVAQFAQIQAHFAALRSSVSSYPPGRVAALLISVRNARRNEFRRRQKEEQQKKQEERNRRILERAQAPPPSAAVSSTNILLIC